MKSPAISVIVAVYNADKTLTRLLDSLKVQTLSDFEVLMIDDGSTDNSGDICDRYAEEDKRFKTFHKQNEGIGKTRQYGIEHANGEYTIHADADDWVEPDYLEKLYNKALETGADMVICDMLIEENGKQTYINQEPKSKDTEGLIKEFLTRMPGGPCNKFLKRSVYTEQGIKYLHNLNYGEDLIFDLQFIMTGASVSYVSKALYHYDYSANPNSAVHGSVLKKIQNREKFITELRNLLPDRFEIYIDNKQLDVAYMAIQSKLFTKRQYLDSYSYLSRVKWRDYLNKDFTIKTILWTSLNISYNLAILFSAIKKMVRSLKSTCK